MTPSMETLFGPPSRPEGETRRPPLAAGATPTPVGTGPHSPPAFLVPAVPEPRRPAPQKGDGRPVPLQAIELPYWLDDPLVDSQAMLSAFLAYKGKCHGEAAAQLNDLWMICHRHQTTFTVAGHNVTPEVIRGPQPEVPCRTPGCVKCRDLRGGFQFKWFHPRWENDYVELARPGSWLPRGFIAPDHRPLSVVIGHRPRVFIGSTGHGPRSAPSRRPLSPIIGREQQL